MYNSSVSDSAGANSTTITNIDKTEPSAPTGYNESNGVTYIRGLGTGGSDTGGSTLRGYQYSTNGSSWSGIYGTSTYYTLYSGLTRGTSEACYVRSVDWAGNVSSAYLTYAITKDYTTNCVILYDAVDAEFGYATWRNLSGIVNAGLYNGTLKGDAGFAYESQTSTRKCVVLDGTGDWIQTDYTTNLTQVTIELTVDTIANSSKKQVAAGNPQNGGCHICILTDGTAQFSAYISGDWRRATGTTNVTGGKHHIVGTYDGTYLKVYVDSNLEGTTTYAGTISAPEKYDGKATRFVIGSNPRGTSVNLDTGQAALKGLLYSFRLYGRALTASEISLNYTVDRYTHITTETVP